MYLANFETIPKYVMLPLWIKIEMRWYLYNIWYSQRSVNTVIFLITVIVIFVINHKNPVKESRHKEAPYGQEQLWQPTLAVLHENVPSH